MPDWTTPKTWQTGEAVTASDMNAQVRDNVDHLHTRMENYDEYTLDEASNYTTSSTSFVDVDGTKLALTITTTKDNAVVLVQFYGTVINPSYLYTYFDITVDGVRDPGDDGLTFGQSISGGYAQVSFTRLIVIPTAGEHTFKLQWKVSSNTTTLHCKTLHPQFWAKEL